MASVAAPLNANNIVRPSLGRDGSQACLALPLSNLDLADERFSHAPPIVHGFMSRTFRPMTDGAMRPSIFTLVSTAVGGGVLTIPYMFRLCGIVNGILLLVLGAFVANETMYILMVAANKTNCPTYGALMAKCLGKDSAVLLDTVLCLYGVGAIISYLIFLGDFIPQVASFMGFNISRTVAIWGVAAVGAPLAMPRTLGIFKFVSPFATFALILTASVAVYKVCTEGVIPIDGTPASHSLSIVNVDIFKCFGIATFSFNCHMNVVPVSVEMKAPSDRRLWKVTTRVSLVELIFYGVIGIAGYTSFGVGTDQNFVSNYPATDPMAFAVRLALSTAIVFGVPINMSPTATSAANVIRYLATGAEDREKLLKGELGSPATWMRCSLVVFFMVIAATVAWQCKNVADVCGLMGGTLGIFILAIVPLIVFKKGLTEAAPSLLLSSGAESQVTPMQRAKCMPHVIVGVLTIMSVVNIVGSGFTLYKMINPSPIA